MILTCVLKMEKKLLFVAGQVVGNLQSLIFYSDYMRYNKVRFI